MERKLRVLVIDDSAVNRRLVSDILRSHPHIEVEASAPDGETGLKLAAELKPDLITLDLEMPRMDGFTFLRLLMSQMPTPVIVVSSHSAKSDVFHALELGALDFVAKPSQVLTSEPPQLRRELVAKALAIRNLQIIPFANIPNRRQTTGEQPAAKVEPPQREVARVVCIGASTGGPPALQQLLTTITNPGATSFLVAQHMPEKFTRAFAKRLDRLASLQIKEGEDGEVVRPGVVYIAPGGHHMLVEESNGAYRLRLWLAAPEDRYVPSIDRLFSSAAGAFGSRMLAVVLTGMGSDGSAGIQDVASARGHSIAESAETAIVYGMPKEAMATGCVDLELPFDRVVTQILDYAATGKLTTGDA